MPVTLATQSHDTGDEDDDDDDYAKHVQFIRLTACLYTRTLLYKTKGNNTNLLEFHSKRPAAPSLP